eukprot:TRINITY_DN136783_c0_g1_i1.p1 TRINITY_DN136783_c0_g1~~TRINITY_DN136783_c0_g1_i1.p1  ORF type:complete len:443 (+),score=-6.74 TRINITY_DN136783_c0_g1_i1:134-1330(+)
MCVAILQISLHTINSITILCSRQQILVTLKNTPTFIPDQHHIAIINRMASSGSIFWLIWTCSVIGSAIANVIETSIQLNQYLSSFDETPFCKSSGLSQKSAEAAKDGLNRLSGISALCGVCFIIQSFFSGIIPIYFHSQNDNMYERIVSIFGFLLEVLWMTAALPIYAIEFTEEADGTLCMETLTDMQTYSEVAYVFWFCFAILILGAAVSMCCGILSSNNKESIENEEADCIRGIIRMVIIGLIIMALLTYTYIAVLYLTIIYDPGAAIAFTHFAVTFFNAAVLKCGCITQNFGNFHMPWQVMSEKVTPMGPKEIAATAGAVLGYVPEPGNSSNIPQLSSSRRQLKKGGQRGLKNNYRDSHRTDNQPKGGSRAKSQPGRKFNIQLNKQLILFINLLR